MSKYTSLTRLDSYGCTMTSFTSLTKLKVLSINNYTILEHECAVLTNITKLHVGHSNITNVTLLKFPLLVNLHVGTTDITDYGIRQLTNLTTLHAPYSSDKALVGLTNLTKLETGTDIDADFISNIKCTDLREHVKLRKLQIYGTVPVENVIRISNLTDLICCCDEITDAQLASFASASTLIRLKFDNEVNCDCSGLASFTNLTYLDIRDCPRARLDNLSTLVNLREIHIDPESREPADGLAYFPKLKVVSGSGVLETRCNALWPHIKTLGIRWHRLFTK